MPCSWACVSHGTMRVGQPDLVPAVAGEDDVDFRWILVQDVVDG